VSAPQNRPFVLIIRDGWGENPHPEHAAYNAILRADTPVADELMREWPNVLVRTSGEAVGLPRGTMGNSEVGHQNIGAGRIVDQEAVRIGRACRDGLESNEVLSRAVKRARDEGAAVHLMGICSDAGVHGLLDHLYALLRLCSEHGVDRVYIHLFTDGRDTGPHTGVGYADEVEAACRSIGVGRVASVIGRYWAMDRDSRWDRVKRAYDCLVGHGEHERFKGTPEAIALYYANPEGRTMRGDEIVTPRYVGPSDGAVAASRIKSGDTVICYNFRGDRPRELVSAFVCEEFHGAERFNPSPDTGERGFDRGEKLDLDFVMMTAYSERLAEVCSVAFTRPDRMENIAGEFLSGIGLRQFRCAETEKFPHVTFFFNDYHDDPYPGESREIVQSPRVATYDLQPEMSAGEVRDAVLGRLGADDCEDVIVVNFANGDMVGHTGDLKAAIRACETVDACVGEVVNATLKRGGSLIVTADHGNAEQMWDPENHSPHTAHTLYDVPLIVVGKAFKDRKLRGGGCLGDIMPTALEMMGITKPAEMTGRSLLE